MCDDDALRGLLAVILDQGSDCDTARLVYADRCDELGLCERAEFIRVQCELAKCPSCLVEGLVVNWQTPLRACRDVFREWHQDRGQGPYCEPCHTFVRLRRRERELWQAHGTDWVADAWPDASDVTHDGGTSFHVFGEGVPALDGEFRRGFVESVTCEAADWLRHADAILAAHPVREVTLTTLPDDTQFLPKWQERWPRLTVLLARAITQPLFG